MRRHGSEDPPWHAPVFSLKIYRNESALHQHVWRHIHPTLVNVIYQLCSIKHSTSNRVSSYLRGADCPGCDTNGRYVSRVIASKSRHFVKKSRHFVSNTSSTVATRIHRNQDIFHCLPYCTIIPSLAQLPYRQNKPNHNKQQLSKMAETSSIYVLIAHSPCCPLLISPSTQKM